MPLNVKNMFPVAFSDTKLGKEAIDDIQYLVDKADLLEPSILTKYTDQATQQQVIEELGLGYLFDLMASTGTPINTIRAFTPALHAHKGTRHGIELLLNLMGLTGVIGTANIYEWWESPTTTGLVLPQVQRLMPNTYHIRLTLATGAIAPANIYAAFRALSPKYVLPMLDIGSISKAKQPLYFEVMGSTNYRYKTSALINNEPTIHSQAIGLTKSVFTTTAI